MFNMYVLDSMLLFKFSKQAYPWYCYRCIWIDEYDPVEDEIDVVHFNRNSDIL